MSKCKNGTDMLCRAVYRREAQAADYLGGSQAPMLYDATKAIHTLRAELEKMTDQRDKLREAARLASKETEEVRAELEHTTSLWRGSRDYARAMEHERHEERAELEKAQNLCATLKQEAVIQAQEMRTQRETVRECYRIATGGDGEPGDWNGAEPIRKLRDDRAASRGIRHLFRSIQRNVPVVTAKAIVADAGELAKGQLSTTWASVNDRWPTHEDVDEDDEAYGWDGEKVEKAHRLDLIDEAYGITHWHPKPKATPPAPPGQTAEDA